MNEASPLRISSIDHSPETIGFEAAKALHRSMLGRRPTKRPKLLRNMRIVTRQSSDIMAIDDELLAAAITFMRRHANEGILVSDVMKAVPMSRRVLEEKCKALLGRSPAAEIRRQRIEEAKELLATTNLPMDKVAQRPATAMAISSAATFVWLLGRPRPRTDGVVVVDYSFRVHPKEAHMEHNPYEPSHVPHSEPRSRDRWPWWVRTGLYGLSSRTTAVVWMWGNVALVPVVFLMLHYIGIRLFESAVLALLFLVSAAAYWLAIRWVDQTTRGMSEGGSSVGQPAGSRFWHSGEKSPRIRAKH